MKTFGFAGLPKVLTTSATPFYSRSTPGCSTSLHRAACHVIRERGDCMSLEELVVVRLVRSVSLPLVATKSGYIARRALATLGAWRSLWWRGWFDLYHRRWLPQSRATSLGERWLLWELGGACGGVVGSICIATVGGRKVGLHRSESDGCLVTGLR